MAVNPTRLKPFELVRLVNSTPLGEALNERRLRRHRASAGVRISDDGQTVNLIRYAAWLAECMEFAGRGEGQVSIDELETQAGFARISRWSHSEVHQVLELLERKRLIEVDRHMHPWLVRFLHPSTTLWNRLYEEFL